MSRRLLARLGVVLALLVLSGVCTACANACAVAHPHNEPVRIATESAIILWDETTKTEHFIRRASFNSEAKNFGFLVPTPAVPELVETSDDAFKELAEITKPRVEKQQRPAGTGGCSFACSKAAAPGDKAAGGVEVLHEGTLGPYDYKVLKIVGRKVETLREWLLDRHYEFTAELEAWVKPYVEEDWIVTAFKINKEAADKPGVSTKAIRMSFTTNQPFFPYREPEDKTPPDKRQSDQRLLRVFFLSTNRVQGTFGKNEEVWPAQTVWANQLSDGQRDKILDLLKMPRDKAPTNLWLTEFEDHSSPRPGKADVYFVRSASVPVERPPHIEYVAAPQPDVMSVALVCCLVVPPVVRALRRRRA
jgi:hypothetical protein